MSTLNFDRINLLWLDATKQLIARELTPIREENERLRGEVDALATINKALASRMEDMERIPAVEPPDLSAFATKADIIEVKDTILSNPDIARKNDIPSLPEPPDLSAFATKADIIEVKDTILSDPDIVRRSDLPEPPDLSSFATKADIIEVKDTILSDPDIARKNDIPSLPEPLDLSAFATKAEVKDTILSDPDIVRRSDIPDLSGFARKDDLDNTRHIIDAILSDPDFARQSDIPDLSGFARKEDLPDFQNWASSVMSGVTDLIKAGQITSLKQNDDGELIMKLASGETHNAGRVRGADGFGFSDIRHEDNERSFKIIFSRDGLPDYEVEVQKPGFWDQGVWVEGKEFLPGDVVTWAGSSWVAKQESQDKKPGETDAWRLLVKRGRDGRDLREPTPLPGKVKR
jgi:hypothetical protein